MPAVLVITFLLTVFVDLVVAVEVGVVLAALLFMGRMAQISDVSAIKNELLDNDEEDDEDRSTAKLSIPEGVEVFDVKGPFFFGAVEQFKDQVLETLEHDTKVVILRMRLVPALDATGLNVLSDFCHQCREHGSTLLVCGVQPQPLDVIRHAPFYRELKRYNICENIDAALNRARQDHQRSRAKTPVTAATPPVRPGRPAPPFIHGFQYGQHAPAEGRQGILHPGRNDGVRLAFH